MLVEEKLQYDKVMKIAKRIRPMLVKMGPPKDVLTAVVLIAIIEYREAGAPLNRFLDVITDLWKAYDDN